MEKVYWAVVEGDCPWDELEWSDRLIKDERRTVVEVVAPTSATFSATETVGEAPAEVTTESPPNMVTPTCSPTPKTNVPTKPATSDCLTVHPLRARLLTWYDVTARMTAHQHTLIRQRQIQAAIVWPEESPLPVFLLPGGRSPHSALDATTSLIQRWPSEQRCWLWRMHTSTCCSKS